MTIAEIIDKNTVQVTPRLDYQYAALVTHRHDAGSHDSVPAEVQVWWWGDTDDLGVEPSSAVVDVSYPREGGIDLFPHAGVPRGVLDGVVELLRDRILQ